MSILERYITKTLLRSAMLALAVLVAIFAFFALIDELENAGQGHYGIWQVLEYLLLSIPHLMSELLPIAAVIGSMLTLGTLSSQNELAVIRSSGVSQSDLLIILSKGAGMLIVIAIIIGELIAPYTEQTAQHRRSVAMTEQITMQTKYGFWSRNENSFINIRTILPGNRVEDIYIYEFDQDNALRSSIYARRAEYIAGQWQLEQVKQSRLYDDKVTSRPMQQANWQSVLSPEVINLVTIKPQYLTLWGLYDYIAYLQDNGQNSVVYQQAFWFKLTKPLAILLMVAIAVPIVRVHSRQNNVGQRVFLGCLLGVLFHMGNQISGHLGVVYELPPVLSTLLPLLVLWLLIIGLLNREKLQRLLLQRGLIPAR